MNEILWIIMHIENHVDIGDTPVSLYATLSRQPKKTHPFSAAKKWRRFQTLMGAVRLVIP